MSEEGCVICDNEDIELLDCNHKVCRDCLVKHAQIKIDSMFHDVCCPAYICQQEIKNIDSYLCSIYRARRKRNANIYRVTDDPRHLKLCPQCEEVCEREYSDELEMICLRCDYHFCFDCTHRYRNEKHVCERIKIESIVKDNEDMKLCPKCNIIIERIEGCDAMRCAYCGFRFCWNCLRLVANIEDMDHHKLMCTHFNGFVTNDYDNPDYVSDSEEE